MEYVCQRIARFPAFGQVPNDVHLRVVCQEGIEDQTIQMLRLRVRADAGIKIRGHRLNQKVDCPGLFGCAIRRTPRAKQHTSQHRCRESHPNALVPGRVCPSLPGAVPRWRTAEYLGGRDTPHRPEPQTRMLLSLPPELRIRWPVQVQFPAGKPPAEPSATDSAHRLPPRYVHLLAHAKKQICATH